MKIVLILLVIIYTSQALLTKGVVLDRWNEFKGLHGRRFINSREENFRMAVFHKRLLNIEDHNMRFSRGLETYEMEVNEFTDYTEEEMKAYTGIEMPLEMPEPLVTIDPNNSINWRSIYSNSSTFDLFVGAPSAPTAPRSLDWRSKGVVTPVKNQGSCGSCWAFATNGAIEAHYSIRSKSTVILSEQQLVDCVRDAHGCRGGWMTSAYTYIARNKGINLQKDYPYQAKDGRCRYNRSKRRVTLRGYASLKKPNEETLKNMVAKGPVSVAIDARGNFAGYKSGVYYNPSCSSTRINHAVVIVGYGRENGQDYWLVKNSWGSQWGQNGYIKMARNRRNNCAIATYASYPVF